MMKNRQQTSFSLLVRTCFFLLHFETANSFQGYRSAIGSLGVDAFRRLDSDVPLLLSNRYRRTTLRTSSSSNNEKENFILETEFDYEEDVNWEKCGSCSLDHHKEEDEFFLASIPTAKTEKDSPILNPTMIIPILTPVLAYMTYDDVARLFNTFFNLLTQDRNWVPVDGGQYQAKIIAPAINGIVVPTISILFATLVSNTVSTLRNRQIDIHTSLNSEAGDLRVLSLLVDSFPSNDIKSRCRQYLDEYTCRLIAESEDSKKSKVMFGSTDSEMNGFVTLLNEYANDKSEPVSGIVLAEAYASVVRLNTIRSARITAIQSTFPVLHYGILALLAFSICIAFLLETDQELLMFLNSEQLRILWTMLIGTISALSIVCWDLSFPFTGSYIISNAVDQLKTIRDTIRAVVED